MPAAKKKAPSVKADAASKAASAAINRVDKMKLDVEKQAGRKSSERS